MDNITPISQHPRWAWSFQPQPEELGDNLGTSHVTEPPKRRSYIRIALWNILQFTGR